MLSSAFSISLNPTYGTASQIPVDAADVIPVLIEQDFRNFEHRPRPEREIA